MPTIFSWAVLYNWHAFQFALLNYSFYVIYYLVNLCGPHILGISNLRDFSNFIMFRLHTICLVCGVAILFSCWLFTNKGFYLNDLSTIDWRWMSYWMLSFLKWLSFLIYFPLYSTFFNSITFVVTAIIIEFHMHFLFCLYF